MGQINSPQIDDLAGSSLAPSIPNGSALTQDSDVVTTARIIHGGPILTPNARLQLLPEAGAQRTLEAVACTPELGTGAGRCDFPPLTCSVRARRYGVTTPLGLRSDGEMVGYLRFKACKRTTGYDAFKMDGVRACRQRCKHQPVAVGDLGR